MVNKQQNVVEITFHSGRYHFSYNHYNYELVDNSRVGVGIFETTIFSFGFRLHVQVLASPVSGWLDLSPLF